MTWIPTDQLMPPPETPVLILLGGEPHIGALFWDHPAYDESYQAYLYWDDPNDDGQSWDWDDVTHWMEIPKLPGFDQGIEEAFYFTRYPEREVAQAAWRDLVLASFESQPYDPDFIPF